VALSIGVIVTACGSSDALRSILRPTTVGHELDGLPSVATLPATRLPPPPTRASAERAYLIALFDDIQSVWRRDFTAAHERYHPARLVVFDRVVESACGKGEDSGPFYCPGDDTVYLDLRFFSMLLVNHGAGPAAQAFIVGHELDITFSD
jgi:predicted metalloprotease